MHKLNVVKTLEEGKADNETIFAVICFTDLIKMPIIVGLL